MSSKLPRCAFCGRPFHPDRYNVHSQECCKRIDCVRDRKRKRQREWYAKKCREDPSFAEAERMRCAEANRRRRASERLLSTEKEISVAPLDVVTGLLGQLTDTTDPEQLRAHLRAYAARGRRLARSFCTNCDPP